MKKSITSSGGHIGSTIIEKSPDFDIKAVCNNCSKRFKSMRAITMHLKMTGARHTVNFRDHGNYNSITGMRKRKRPSLTNVSNGESNDLVMIPQVPALLSGIGDLRARTVINGRC
jgi:hypothetical protein